MFGLLSLTFNLDQSQTNTDIPDSCVRDKCNVMCCVYGAFEFFTFVRIYIIMHLIEPFSQFIFLFSIKLLFFAKSGLMHGVIS